MFGLIWVFAIHYRRGSNARRGPLPQIVSREFEIGWTAGALFLALFLFWWAASANLSALVPPKNALEVHVVAKQWMWKIEHPSGAREIDALHAPLGVPVKLIMTSQDTIHDFYVPAFRMKQDVLPGRYTQEWFTASKLGTYRIECAEYCGTDHAEMGGLVTVMTPDQYAKWTALQPQAGTPAVRGAGDLRQAGLRRLPRGGRSGGGAAGAEPLRPVRPARAPLQRARGHRRRDLPARSDRRAGDGARVRLARGHALLRQGGGRGGAGGPDRLPEDAEARP